MMNHSVIIYKLGLWARTSEILPFSSNSSRDGNCFELIKMTANEYYIKRYGFRFGQTWPFQLDSVLYRWNKGAFAEVTIEMDGYYLFRAIVTLFNEGTCVS